mmetsp:Transcript_1406/g.4195  ORF Transcript_1406/g.4195 Transcript_1406/m.4195 type:complete len:381 (-) Transcript_1406:736-1878(-)
MPPLAKRFSARLPLGAGNWSGKQLFILCAACAATACFTFFLASGDSRGQHKSAAGGFAAATSVGVGAGRQCRLEFASYEPSAWEKKWLFQALQFQDKICPTMLQGEDREMTDVWMEAMLEAFGGHSEKSEVSKLQNNTVWSQFVYRNTCGGEVRQPIEPLVGLLRHPTSHGACERADRPEFIDHLHDGATHPGQIENKKYMVLQPLAASKIAALYPGRKYLFDLGTGQYKSSSLPWLTHWYGSRGIVFDEIFGWELKPIPQAQYWQAFPANMSEKMHFWNIGVSYDRAAPDNPLNIVRRIYRPGDYIAFKLDIDNSGIEQALMDQLSTDIIPMISEFFFELHFHCPEMAPHFGPVPVTYPQALQMFHSFRDRGLRLHYWP